MRTDKSKKLTEEEIQNIFERLNLFNEMDRLNFIFKELDSESDEPADKKITIYFSANPQLFAEEEKETINAELECTP